MVCELCLNEAIMLKNKIRWPAHRPQFADIWNNCIRSPILQLSKLIPEEEENQHLPKCNYVLNSGRFGYELIHVISGYLKQKQFNEKYI